MDAFWGWIFTHLICPYLSNLIEGDFKWTLLGMALTLMAVLVTLILSRWIKPTWARVLILFVLVGLLVWFGHEWMDPYFHQMVNWWNAPIDEPMQLIIR
jgi:hypothetical protein